MYKGIAVQVVPGFKPSKALPAATHIVSSGREKYEVIMVSDADAIYAQGTTLLADVLGEIAERVSSPENCYMQWGSDGTERLEATGKKLPTLRALSDKVLGKQLYGILSDAAWGRFDVLENAPKPLLSALETTRSEVLGIHMPSSFVVPRLYEAFYAVLYDTLADYAGRGQVQEVYDHAYVTAVTSGFLRRVYLCDCEAETLGHYCIMNGRDVLSTLPVKKAMQEYRMTVEALY